MSYLSVEDVIEGDAVLAVQDPSIVPAIVENLIGRKRNFNLTED